MHCCERNAKCSNCGSAHETVNRGCPAYQNKLAEASKKINENKFSAVANKLKPQANTELTPSTEKVAVLVAEVLSEIRTVHNTMSYSDIINFVSNRASSSFNEKIDVQRIHDSIKSANTAPAISIQSNNLSDSQNFSQNGLAQIFAMELSRPKQQNKLSDFIFSRRHRCNLLE